MIPRLDPDFLTRPFAHRALHDVTDGRPENSRAAIRAAIALGYGIEIDVQLSADNQAMVFHDYTLDRLAEGIGTVRQMTAKALSRIALRGSDEAIPTLSETLDLIDGRVPVLIELKDQDGEMGTDIGALEQATARALHGYTGHVGVMSFNPNSVAMLADLLPDTPRGIVTSAYDPQEWHPLPQEVCDRLRDIPDYARTRSSFISHEVEDLSRDTVAMLKQAGADVLCWTVKSPTQEAQARQVAQNITFEGYLAAHSG